MKLDYEFNASDINININDVWQMRHIELTR
ncbi:MAG: hypothetical protein ACI90V_007124 [Bacillariaceae sp.]|jgi:hypothetical protein